MDFFFKFFYINRIKVGGLAFDDTDVYKTIEGASYLLQTYPDKKLAKYIDSVLVIVAAAHTSTSGPGVCLKSEAMNLAVITELPLVVINVVKKKVSQIRHSQNIVLTLSILRVTLTSL